MTKLRSLLLTVAALAVLQGSTARASIVVSLTFPTLVAAPGDTVIFQGTLTNSGPDPIFLNNCGVTSPPNIASDCVTGLFFDNAPLSMNPGDVSGPYGLFSLTVDPSYSGPFGTVSGFFDVFGGPAADSDGLIGEAPFQLQVVPEPGTFALLALALPVALTLKRRIP